MSLAMLIGWPKPAYPPIWATVNAGDESVGGVGDICCTDVRGRFSADVRDCVRLCLVGGGGVGVPEAMGGAERTGCQAPGCRWRGAIGEDDMEMDMRRLEGGGPILMSGV
jgi:hypothetical protein